MFYTPTAPTLENTKNEMKTQFVLMVLLPAASLTDHVSPRDGGSYNLVVAVHRCQLGEVGSTKRLVGRVIVHQHHQLGCAVPTPKNLFEDQWLVQIERCLSTTWM